MTMLFEVYDPKGVMFEVTPAKAKQLIIVNGWSPTKPGTAATPATAATLFVKPIPHIVNVPKPVEAPVEQKETVTAVEAPVEPVASIVEPVHDQPVYRAANAQSDEKPA